MPKCQTQYRIWAISGEGRLSVPIASVYKTHDTLEEAEEHLAEKWEKVDSPQRYVILKEYDYYDW